MFQRLCVGMLLLLVCVVPARGADQVGPLSLAGELEGAPYRIAVPAEWNGTLLVYLPGYRDKADHPGEVDNRSADLGPTPDAEFLLLSQGYALAGTAYGDNGWAVEEGVLDVRRLVSLFRDTVARPDRTLLWAFSTGTVIALKSMEQGAGLFDGALCACALGAGATSTWDASGDLLLAYDTLFGVPFAWGGVGDIRDDIDFETEVLAKLVPEISNPANFAKFEFMRLVSGTPGRGIVPPPPPAFHPGWLFTTMFYATEVRAELERRAMGPFVQNLDREYTLTDGERAYLASLGVPTDAVDTWLMQMNAARTIAAPPAARNYVRRHADFSGRIKHPVLTLHTTIDPLVPVSQQHRYGQTVAAARRSASLVQVYTIGQGHCAFTAPQVLTTLAALDAWVRTGVRPPGEMFPPALGFVPGFVPPPMLQP